MLSGTPWNRLHRGEDRYFLAGSPFAARRIGVRRSADQGTKAMEKLGEGGFRSVLRAIEALGRDLGYDSFPQRAVDAIATAIEVDFVSYNEVDTTTGAKRFVLKPDPADFTPGSFEYAAFIRRFGNHPVIAQKVAATRGVNPDLQRFVNRLRLLGMVGNCCGQAELRLNMGLTVEDAKARRVGIALHRSLRDFNDADSAALDALRPHIVTAYRNALRHREATGVKSDSSAPQASALTKRENEVLYWVSMGKTNGEVGEIIGAKPMTVKKHLEHIYDKLGVPNRTAAARMTVAALGS
jgi:DNA-binding CsgD family transcriptional regulator